ncbi:MAG TPA: sulfotransferase [Tahibacter sp.]|uniref:tetratricopeptide repeat-containing sulfotransferase family protein n=1 Tax=Tahibacter sp. TaxID=2056211 RepID=UPI002C076589|nr:sulfotransferase [Tahibacter sp.]HSX59301.1 sulfotransferase [Tahibacter sp.]
MLQNGFNALQSGNLAEAERISRLLIARQPHDEGALLLLAMSLDAQTRLDEAASMFQQLTTLYPQRAEHWLNLGYLERSRSNIGPARQALERAIAIDPQQAEALRELGLLETAAGLSQAAARNLTAALALLPDDPLLRAQAARACQRAGRNDESIALVQGWQQWTRGNPEALADAAWTAMESGDLQTADEALAFAEHRSPNNAGVIAKRAAFFERTNRLDEARALLARVPQHDESIKEELKVLRAQIASRSGDPNEAYRLYESLVRDERVAARRPELFFALAKISDARGHAEQAMNWLERGHQTQMQQLRASLGTAAELDAMLLPPAVVSPPDYAQWLPVEGPDAENSPIFVVGFPRSGTTLLETMLDAHPLLTCMDERPFIHNLVQEMRDRGFEYPGDLGRLDDAACEALRQIYWKQVREQTKAEPGKRLVDKNPLNMTRLALIHRLFPTAKIVLAVRDPRDVVLSNYMQIFRAPAYVRMCERIESTAQGYAVAFDAWNAWTRVLKIDLLQTRLEDVVDDVEAFSRRLCEFLGIEWSSAMVAFHEHAARRGYIATPSYHQVVEPVNRKGVGRWLHYSRWLEPAKVTLAPYVEQFGYA